MVTPLPLGCPPWVKFNPKALVQVVPLKEYLMLLGVAVALSPPTAIQLVPVQATLLPLFKNLYYFLF